MKTADQWMRCFMDENGSCCTPSGTSTQVNATDIARIQRDAWNSAIASAASCIVEDGNPAVALIRINRLRYQ